MIRQRRRAEAQARGADEALVEGEAASRARSVDRAAGGESAVVT